MKKWILIGFISLMVWSCNNDPKKEPGAESTPKQNQDVTEFVDTVLNKETISFFDQSGYSTFAKSRAKGFDWSRFHMVDSFEDTLMKTEFDSGKNFLTYYGPFLKYSPDSSFAIDLDSYNVEITKNKAGKLIGIEQGPDTEVGLIDFRKKERRRLVFVGPGGSVEDAGWLDEDNLVLIGLIDANDKESSRVSVIWKYHLPTHTFYQYQSMDTASLQLQGYTWKERLKGVMIQ